MLNQWLKPKWEHPDPLVRLEAIGERDMEQPVLQRLAKEDPSLDVRRAAIRRLHDMHFLVGLCAVASEVSQAARVRLQVLLRSLEPGGEPAPALLAEAITVCDDPLLTQTLACESGSAPLRRAALELVRDEPTLARIAAEDASPEIRLAAFERVRSEDSLAELERAVRNRDKRVAQAARQRLAEIRDRRERCAERGRIIAELDGRGRGDSWPADEAAELRLRERWQALEADAEPDERERYGRAEAAFRERLEAYREERRHHRQIRQQVDHLCAELESLAGGASAMTPEAVEARLRDVDAVRRTLEPAARERGMVDAVSRVETLRGAAARALEAARARTALESTLAGLEADAEALKGQERPGPGRLDALRRALGELPGGISPELDARRRALGERLSAIQERTRRAEQADGEQLQELEQALEDLERALGESRLEPALRSHKRATELLRGLPGLSQGRRQRLEGKLRGCGRRLAELKSWRHWGSDHAREALIGRAEGLAGAELPPEKLGARIDELRKEWKHLGRMDAAGKKLWERFDAACTRAYQPVLEHRKEAARERSRNLEERAALCAELEAIERGTDWSAPDWRAVDKQIHRLRARWRNAGAVDRRDWQVVRTRYEEAVGALEEHLEPERRRNHRQREALILEAEALTESRDSREAAREARRLSEAWQVTVSSAPAEERSLWKRFRAALDLVFEQERAERDSHRQALSENLARAQSLCEEMEGLAAGPAGQAPTRQSDAERLSEAFRGLGPLPGKARRRVEERFEQARRGFRRHLDQGREALRRNRLEELRAAARICERLEQAAMEQTADASVLEALQAEWSGLPALEEESARRLQGRFEEALRAAASPEAREELIARARRGLEQCRALCLDLEILAGIDSPAGEHDARLARQVEMLARSMQGSRPGDRSAEIRRLERDCLLCGPVPPEAAAAHRARLQAVLDQTRPAV